jgi:hypothetical protein
MNERKKTENIDNLLDEGVRHLESIEEKTKKSMETGQKILEKTEELKGFFTWTMENAGVFKSYLSDPCNPFYYAASRYSSALGSMVTNLKETDASFVDFQQSIGPTLSGCSACATSGSGVFTSFRAEYVSLPQATYGEAGPIGRIDFDKCPFDQKKIQQDLDSFIVNIDSELVNKRKGAWEAFVSSRNDKYSQACYSMRDVLTKILDKFCSVDSVRSAEWWSYVTDTKEGVSKKQKIKYFICGNKDSDITAPTLELVTNCVDECKRLHGILIGVAHGADDQRVKAYLEAMESALMNMFQLRDRIEKGRGIHRD